MVILFYDVIYGHLRRIACSKLIQQEDVHFPERLDSFFIDSASLWIWGLYQQVLQLVVQFFYFSCLYLKAHDDILSFLSYQSHNVHIWLMLCTSISNELWNAHNPLHRKVVFRVSLYHQWVPIINTPLFYRCICISLALFLLSSAAKTLKTPMMSLVNQLHDRKRLTWLFFVKVDLLTPVLRMSDMFCLSYIFLI